MASSHSRLSTEHDVTDGRSHAANKEQLRIMDTTPGANRDSEQTPAQTPDESTRSAEIASIHRLVHTPLDRSGPRGLLHSVQRGASASGGPRRRGNAPTPHAKAARQALNRRRTALFTPGKLRRRSLMEQRETPMGILRNLGRALAPKSKPVLSSSSSPRETTSDIGPIREEESDDELPIDRPRFSLPLDEDDDEDLLPPRSSGLEEENYTVQSVELPRRVDVERDNAGLGRTSLDSRRFSEAFNDADQTGDVGRESDFFPGLLENLQARADAGNDLAYDRVDDDLERRTTLGRESDFGLQMPEGLDDQTTFMLSEPVGDQALTSPTGDASVLEATAHDDRHMTEPALAPADYSDSDGGGDAGMDFGDDGGDDAGIDFGDDGTGFLNDATGFADEATGLETEADGDMTGISVLEGRKHPIAKRNSKRVSRHGIEYPALPPAFVKRVAQTSLKTSGLGGNGRLSADTLTALTQASEWYFEQLGEDLGAYADHAKRKTIEESDVATLMRRQRQIGPTATMFSLAQRHLPRELLQELKMPVHQPAKQRKAPKSNRVSKR